MDICKKTNNYRELLDDANSNIVHGTNSSIYLATTSNVRGTLGIYSDYDNVLSVGSTGAQGFEALLNGAKKIDLFDINIYQKYYFEYIKIAIMHLSYEDFIKYFSIAEFSSMLNPELYENLLSHKLYEKTSKYLIGDTKIFFDYIYDNYNDNSFLFTSLFRYDYDLYLGNLKQMASFYNKDDFMKLKNILHTYGTIDYKICSIENLKENFNGTYDLILFDNILRYYQTMDNLNNKDKIINYIEKDITSMLNENGKLQAIYLFKTWSYYLGITLESIEPNDFNELYGRIHYLENDISYDLLTKYDNYYATRISGVEDKFNVHSNTIITKVRK